MSESQEELTESEKAVRKVFAILGVNIDKPEQVEEFREDLRFGRNVRKLAGNGMVAVVTVIAGSMVYTFFNGIMHAIQSAMAAIGKGGG